jgi:hypothetical protein
MCGSGKLFQNSEKDANLEVNRKKERKEARTYFVIG